MIVASVGPMSGDDFVGLVVAAFIAAYLVYALLRPENL
jgi:K+-transporting ATPase KdpF subunit